MHLHMGVYSAVGDGAAGMAQAAPLLAANKPLTLQIHVHSAVYEVQFKSQTGIANSKKWPGSQTMIATLRGRASGYQQSRKPWNCISEASIPGILSQFPVQHPPRPPQLGHLVRPVCYDPK